MVVDLVAKGQLYGIMHAILELLAVLEDHLQEFTEAESEADHETLMTLCKVLREIRVDLYNRIDQFLEAK